MPIFLPVFCQHFKWTLVCACACVSVCLLVSASVRVIIIYYIINLIPAPLTPYWTPLLPHCPPQMPCSPPLPPTDAMLVPTAPTAPPTDAMLAPTSIPTAPRPSPTRLAEGHGDMLTERRAVYTCVKMARLRRQVLEMVLSLQETTPLFSSITIPPSFMFTEGPGLLMSTQPAAPHHSHIWPAPDLLTPHTHHPSGLRGPANRFSKLLPVRISSFITLGQRNINTEKRVRVLFSFFPSSFSVFLSFSQFLFRFFFHFLSRFSKNILVKYLF